MPSSIESGESEEHELEEIPQKRGSLKSGKQAKKKHRKNEGLFTILKKLWKNVSKLENQLPIIVIQFLLKLGLSISDLVFDWIFYKELWNYSLAPGIATYARWAYLGMMFVATGVFLVELVLIIAHFFLNLMISFETDKEERKMDEEAKNWVTFISSVCGIFLEELPLTVIILLILSFGTNCSLVSQFMFSWQARAKLAIGVVAFAKRSYGFFKSSSKSVCAPPPPPESDVELDCECCTKCCLCLCCGSRVLGKIVIVLFLAGLAFLKGTLLIASFSSAVANWGIVHNPVHVQFRYGATYVMHMRRLEPCSLDDGKLSYCWNTTNVTVFHGLRNQSQDISLELIRKSKVDISFPCSEMVILPDNNPLPEVNTSLIQNCTVYIALQYYPLNNTIAYNAIYELTLKQGGHICLDFINSPLHLQWSQDALTYAFNETCQAVGPPLLQKDQASLPVVTCESWCNPNCTQCSLNALSGSPSEYQAADNCTCKTNPPTSCNVNQCKFKILQNCSSSEPGVPDSSFLLQNSSYCQPVPSKSGQPSCFIDREPTAMFTESSAVNMLGPLKVTVVGCQDPPAFYIPTLSAPSHCG